MSLIARKRTNQRKMSANGGGDGFSDADGLSQSGGDADLQTTAAERMSHELPASHRELGMEIFRAANPVKAGKELLEGNEGRNAPTRLNSLKTFADWIWGEREAPRRKPPRVIWDIPCPPYEPVDPVEAGPQNAEGGEP